MSIEVGSVVEGVVTGITNFGAFVELPEGKVGLIHISEVADVYVRDVKDFGVFVSLEGGVDALIRNEDLYPLIPEELEIGQTIEAAILVIDAKRDRIRLSVKKLERIKDQKMLDEFNDNDSHSLGDLIKDQLK